MALNVLLERVGMFFCLINCSCQSFYLPPPCMPPPPFNLIQYPLQLLLQFLNEKPLTSCLTLSHSLLSFNQLIKAICKLLWVIFLF